VIAAEFLLAVAIEKTATELILIAEAISWPTTRPAVSAARRCVHHYEG
jgi:hypothetical protein